jgi:ferritin-like metal-binding protein YciE
MTQITTLHELFLDQLRDLYNAERQLLNTALPRMIDNAGSPELIEALRGHQNETETQLKRLDNIFEGLGESPQGEICEAMKGLVTELEEAVETISNRDLRDVALVAEAQRIEHYEISGYGTACALAGSLGLNDIQQQLHETLEEEKEADQRLNDLALGNVNEKAYQSVA